MGKSTILIGFMGAGKSSVGRALARRSGIPLLDTDKEIERKQGMTISRMFETQGEESFRKAETEFIQSLLAREDAMVISVGGGLPLREENQVLLRKLGTVVYLQVQPDTVLRRLRGDTARPLLRGGDVRERVEHLLWQRAPIYRQAAHMVVDTDHKTPDEIAAEILTMNGGGSCEPFGGCTQNAKNAGGTVL